jgi:hypothetical protein
VFIIMQVLVQGTQSYSYSAVKQAALIYFSLTKSRGKARQVVCALTLPTYIGVAGAPISSAEFFGSDAFPLLFRLLPLPPFCSALSAGFHSS